MSDEGNRKCSMTGLVGILIQVSLGVLSFSILIVKRFLEKPKRPWKIWSLDTSKQIISQLIAHFINLTISIILTYDDDTSDECLWYFTTNILDNTIGVFICVLVLKLTQKRLKKKRQFHLISGNYYEKTKMNSQPKEMTEVKEEILKEGELVEEKQQSKDKQIEPFEIQKTMITEVEQPEYIINVKAWGIQLCIWNAIVVLAKCVLFGIEIGLRSPLQNFTFLILGWIEDYPVFELIVVIVIVPVILNALAFWVQDNFLMKKEAINENQALLTAAQSKQIKSQHLVI